MDGHTQYSRDRRPHPNFHNLEQYGSIPCWSHATTKVAAKKRLPKTHAFMQKKGRQFRGSGLQTRSIACSIKDCPTAVQYAVLHSAACSIMSVPGRSAFCSAACSIKLLRHSKVCSIASCSQRPSSLLVMLALCIAAIRAAWTVLYSPAAPLRALKDGAASATSAKSVTENKHIGVSGHAGEFLPHKNIHWHTNPFRMCEANAMDI
eukprot:1158844-Pelagomonas_calceolata.AAC.6